MDIVSIVDGECKFSGANPGENADIAGELDRLEDGLIPASKIHVDREGAQQLGNLPLVCLDVPTVT